MESPNLFIPGSQQDIPSCLICCNIVLPSENDLNFGQPQVPEILSELFEILCKYLKWGHPSKYQFNFLTDSFPFCKDCKSSIVKLYRLHEKLEQIMGKINGIALALSVKVLKSQNDANWRKENERISSLQKGFGEILTKDSKKMSYNRNLLYECYSTSSPSLFNPHQGNTEDDTLSKMDGNYMVSKHEAQIIESLSLTGSVTATACPETDKTAKFNGSSGQMLAAAKSFIENIPLDKLERTSVISTETNVLFATRVKFGSDNKDEVCGENLNIRMTDTRTVAEDCGNPAVPPSPQAKTMQENTGSAVPSPNLNPPRKLTSDEMLSFKKFENVYWCSKCLSYSCSSRSDMERHFKIKHDPNTFLCKNCGKTFNTEKSLVQHQKIHKFSSKPSSLNLRSSKTEDAPKEIRSKRHQTASELTCKECRKAFAGTSELKSHLLSHARVMRGIGGGKIVYSTQAKNRRHDIYDRNNQPTVLENILPVMSKEVHEEADGEGNTESCIENKAKEHSANESSNIRIPSKPSNNKIHHTISSTNSSPKPTTAAPTQLRVVTLSSSDLLKSSTPSTSLLKSSSTSLLNKSQKVAPVPPVSATGSPANDASKCNKRRRHACFLPSCNKIYTKSSKLQAHLLTHASKGPYKCNRVGCGRQFGRSDHLTRHYLQHIGGRPLRCRLCKVDFSRRDSLARHMKNCHESGQRL